MTTQRPTTRFNADTGVFTSIKDERELSVTARTVRGRWQYRAPNGQLLASGVTPAQFVAQFWFGRLEEDS